MTKLTEKYLWVEKYRPQTIDDVVLPDEYDKAFRKYLQDKEIPNLLLIGTQGSGKTTLARIMIEQLTDRDDVMELNGSASTGVDIVRDLIEEFLKVPSFGSNIKIIFIDEFDYMSKNAMAALRNVIEKYSDVGRFILTANYKSKIIDPLFSRVTSFEFKKLPNEFIQDYCYKILDSEQITYDKGFVDKVITMYYPDVRRVVNTLQGKVHEGALMSDYESLVSSEKKAHSFVYDLCEGINSKNPKLANSAIVNTHALLKEGELDYISLYQDVFEDDKIPIWAKIVINDYARTHTEALVPAMHWCAMLYKIGKTGKELLALRK